MTDKKDDQSFDDWFASHFPHGQKKPVADAVPPPSLPPQPQFPQQPPVTFDPSLGGAGIPPQPVGPPEPYPLTEPSMPNEWVNPTVPPNEWVNPPVPPTVDFGLEGQDGVPTEFIPSAVQAAGGAATEANALDALFGEDRFQEYEDALVSPTPPPATPVEPGEGGGEPPGGISTLHVTMMWVAGSVVAALALFAFFLVGTKLPMLSGPTPTDPSSAPVETERPVGPVEPGTYNWNELLGGECLEEFRGAWENEYTVVDCAVPHAAQLVIRGPVPVVAGTGGTYPGVLDLQSRMNLLCTDAAVIDYEAASSYDEVQFEASFPPSAEEWDAGRRDYFCFVSLASGDLIEGNLAAPPAPDVPATDEEGTDEEGTEGD